MTGPRMAEQWWRDGDGLIAEAEEIARVCREAGRPELAEWPEHVAAETRQRMASARRGFWWRVSQTLAGAYRP